jgi:hypothetical protein
VSIRVLDGEKETEVVEVGEGPILNPAQQALLRSLDYSSNFVIRAKFTGKDNASGTTGWELATPYVTVVPEQEAVNSAGREALLAYCEARHFGLPLHRGRQETPVRQDHLHRRSHRYGLERPPDVKRRLSGAGCTGDGTDEHLTRDLGASHQRER